MIRLLRANMTRLGMNGVFRAGIPVSAGMGALCPVIAGWMVNRKNALINLAIGNLSEEELSLDHFLFPWMIFLAVYFALQCSCFVGTDCHDGTVRNKIAAGYSRTDIYMADFIANAAAGCILFTIYIIPAWCAGRLYLGKLQVFTQSGMVAYILLMYVLMIALAGICTMVSMLISSEALAVILCLGIVVAFLLLAIWMIYSLDAPEYFEPAFEGDDSTYIIRGITYHMGDPNPYYVGGVRRVLDQFLLNFLPGGAFMIFFMYMSDTVLFELNVGICFLGAAFFAAVPTMAGVALFRRKELK